MCNVAPVIYFVGPSTVTTLCFQVSDSIGMILPILYLTNDTSGCYTFSHLQVQIEGKIRVKCPELRGGTAHNFARHVSRNHFNISIVFVFFKTCLLYRIHLNLDSYLQPMQLNCFVVNKRVNDPSSPDNFISNKKKR